MGGGEWVKIIEDINGNSGGDLMVGKTEVG